MGSFIIAALALCSLTAPAHGDKGTSKARSCSDIRQFYSGKGFYLDGVPQSEISGEHLRICPQGYTCCTSDMEDNLASLSRREMEGLLKEAGRSLQTSLNGQYKIFDGYFLELLNRSALTLDETFTTTYGLLYSQNAQVFSDLYADLRQYYRGSNINLEEVLNEFWARLMEKLFHQANKQYVIGEDYLECVSKQIETLRPFADTPRVMKMMVTRTFVAARSFVQGLLVSGEVVRKVSQVQLSPECTRAMMRMTYCPHCRGMASARPCANYCSNVMKGCLANQADLNTEWRHLAETMMQVADRFDGPSGVDSVVLSLPYRISEAVLNMMDNMATINSKLFQACGNLREGGTSSTGVEEATKRGRFTVEDRMETSSSKMDKLVSDVTVRLRDMQSYWVSLPSLLCSDRVATGTGAEEKCWNGMSRARYLPEVMGDGLASQINNPEVEIDITKPDMTIRQQIMQLKIMTHRSKNALNGQDVDFQDTSDDVSGSGSGMCTEEMCSRGPRLIDPVTERPIRYPYLPENKKVKASANHNLPCVATYLIPLLLLLLRR
ncbi:glypican-1b [Hippoglossus hippoglossus]|uniref:glypican-1b n=1 Tax=Hippoglossus hippoglossus TaxID=8267 RepID=UPI00148E6C0E|nr:glypican-1b [Hippoglossus hippoglossus]XP_034468956.1 glypican-1b [Hippoglossus hippoglossus]XP_035027140.1 glypican-1b [Hippoglossus stenolepis]XP_035027141.1 glypican-1b [Hippoglossus stenolepis]